MKRKAFWSMIGIIAASAIAAGGAGVLGQEPAPVHFSGVINDYTAAKTTNGTTTGPSELRGLWSLRLNGQSDAASFSAVLTMETSDYGIAEGIVNPAIPQSRGPHTHHITMTDATVNEDPAQVLADCPPSAPRVPAYTPRLEVNGMADVAANGQAPFGAGVLSPLQVCIDGGSEIQFSNVTLVFGKPASGHFGSQPINGVVSKTTRTDDAHEHE